LPQSLRTNERVRLSTEGYYSQVVKNTEWSAK